MDYRTKGVAIAAWVAMACAIAAMPAHAQTSTRTGRTVRASEIGHATNGWLEMQRTNVSAAPAQPMLGEEAGLAYHRYMESFKSKIPDLYGSAVNQGSGGSGTSGSGLSPSN
ncbi:DUF3613 domain-containing protein [Paraburkholderia sp.]|uniref:DUF3613 domain-containing protein n=1 Tax=Paraburkholderia sp. TaxID=1926495 RepID=UPI003D6F6FE8